MYCLKVEKLKNNKDLNVKTVIDTTYISFEDFEDLYNDKQLFDKKGNRYYSYKTSVYKISNNGVKIEMLNDLNLYKEVENIDRELQKALTDYSYIRKVLSKTKKKFYIKDNVLIVSPKKLKLEIEKVKTTPKYEVRLNGELLFTESTQTDIVKILKNEYNISLDE